MDYNADYSTRSSTREYTDYSSTRSTNLEWYNDTSTRSLTRTGSSPPPPPPHQPAPPTPRHRRSLSRLAQMSPWMNASRRHVPPLRKWGEQTTSEHMLPTDIHSGRNSTRTVFSSRHRLVKRNLPFFQSKNEMQVSNQHMEFRLWKLLWQDWFHVFLRMDIMLSLCLLLGGWILCVVLFAFIYMHIDRINPAENCGLGGVGNPIKFGPAYAFSLETCTTVGYGLPNGTNAFFESNCPQVQVAICFQMMWSMLFNAFLFAFFFARLAKCESRGVQVIFSQKAIIGNRPECPYPCFFFRLFDADARHPVVEAHVRMYVITQRSPIPMPLRTLIPNDDLGGMLYMSLPCQIVHAMDQYSPLIPRAKFSCPASSTVPHHGLNLRQADSTTNNRDDVNCPVCGESYGTVERLIKHGKFNTLTESHEKLPVAGSHQEVNWDEWSDLLEKSTTWTIPQLHAYFRSAVSEILCVVEGIDPLASGTFQALHSYQIDDIHFGNAHFADCVCLDENMSCVVDLDFFHKIKSEDDDGDGSSNHWENDKYSSGRQHPLHNSDNNGNNNHPNVNRTASDSSMDNSPVMALPPFPGAKGVLPPGWPPSPIEKQQQQPQQPIPPFPGSKGLLPPGWPPSPSEQQQQPQPILHSKPPRSQSVPKKRVTMTSPEDTTHNAFKPRSSSHQYGTINDPPP